MASRVFYGMSRAGWLHAVFGRVHWRTRTPLLSTAIVTALVLVLALWLPIVTLAKATSLIVLVVFTLVNLALVRIKLRAPKLKRGPCFPLWVPLTGLLASGVFVLFQILDYWRNG
jgi:amino acid transporter